jgi:hypothetical protein
VDWDLKQYQIRGMNTRIPEYQINNLSIHHELLGMFAEKEKGSCNLIYKK